MMKRSVLEVASLSVMLLALASVLATPRATDDWPMFHHDVRNTGYSTCEMPDPIQMTMLWSYGIVALAPGGGAICSSPSVADGRVYFTARDRNLYCLDAYTGAFLWKQPLGSMWDTGFGGFNHWLDSSPAVDVDGERVFVGARDGFMYAFDSIDGDPLWSVDLLSPVISSPLYIDGEGDDKLFVCSGEGGLWWLDPAAGDPPHDSYFTGNPPILNSPALKGSNELVFGSGVEPGAVHAVSFGPKGFTAAVFPYDTGCWVRSSPMIEGHRVYQGDGSGTWPNGLLCMPGVGSPVWYYNDHGNHEWTCATPALGDGLIYMVGGVQAPDLYCLRDDGDTYDEQWRWEDEAYSNCVSPAVADGLVFIAITKLQFGQKHSWLHCIDAITGNPLREFYLGVGLERILSSPTIYDGKVYIGSPGGRLYCFGGTESGDSYTPSDDYRTSVADGETTVLPASRDGFQPAGVLQLLTRGEARREKVILYDITGRKAGSGPNGMLYGEDGRRVLIVR